MAKENAVDAELFTTTMTARGKFFYLLSSEKMKSRIYRGMKPSSSVHSYRNGGDYMGKEFDEIMGGLNEMKSFLGGGPIMSEAAS